jgi:hypothetical protein
MEDIMKIYKLWPFLFIMCFITFNANAQMSKENLQQMYLTYLRGEGYSPEIDSDGDILFKVEGRTLFIIVYNEDLEYFKILYPYFWEIESEPEREKVAEAASYATRTTKVVRVYMESDDDTSIDACILVEKPENFKIHFKRMIDAIFLARRKFIEKMNE